MEITITPAQVLAKQEKVLSFITDKVSARELSLFAKFAKTQIGNKDDLLQTLEDSNEILARIAGIFSQRVIPSGISLNGLLTQFSSWHSKDGAGIKRLGTVADKIPERLLPGIEEEGNMSADEAGGITLQKIGSMLDSERTFTPTAINDILKKLTVSGGKLDVLREMIRHYLGCWADGDKNGIKNFTVAMKRAVVQAAGRFIDYLEEARSMDLNGDIVTLSNFHKVLDVNKLRDSMSTEDMERENVFLQTLVDYANNVELATDDEWKDIVMEMLSIDLLDSPTFGSRDELNLSKSFQNLVSNILKPPPRRGRPPKTK